jgi:hypothetical protein
MEIPLSREIFLIGTLFIHEGFPLALFDDRRVDLDLLGIIY